MAAAHHIQWPDLRTPPINLWVMPQWRRDAYRDVARPAPQRKAAAAKLLDRHLALLAARTGNGESNGNQD